MRERERQSERQTEIENGGGRVIRSVHPTWGSLLWNSLIRIYLRHSLGCNGSASKPWRDKFFQPAGTSGKGGGKHYKIIGTNAYMHTHIYTGTYMHAYI